jgi:hypothetical protein
MITVESPAGPAAGTDTAALRRVRHKTDDLDYLLAVSRANMTTVLGYAAVR